MVVKHDKPFLTPKEAAKILKVSRCTIYRWLRREWITGITLPSGAKRITRASVDKVLDTGK